MLQTQNPEMIRDQEQIFKPDFVYKQTAVLIYLFVYLFMDVGHCKIKRPKTVLTVLLSTYYATLESEYDGREIIKLIIIIRKIIIITIPIITTSI